MAEAARGRDVQPREPSFNGARQTIRAFEQTHLYEPKQIASDSPLLLDLIVQKRVGGRPDRYEPRAIKRRPKPYRLLMSRASRDHANVLHLFGLDHNRLAEPFTLTGEPRRAPIMACFHHKKLRILAPCSKSCIKTGSSG
jgi:hypothetical protein